MNGWLHSPDLRLVLELLYYASGVVIAIAALCALRQITLARASVNAAKVQLAIAARSLELAKDDIKIRSQREAVAMAADRCEKFANMIPKCGKLINEMTNRGVDIHRWETSPEIFDDPTILERPEVAHWLSTFHASNENVAGLLAVLNDLEAFAVYFAKGAAEEEVAYPVVSDLFCEWVEFFVPSIVGMRTKGVAGITAGPYQNTVDLYSLWSARKRRKSLEEQESKIRLQLSGLRVSPIRPIGTGSSS